MFLDKSRPAPRASNWWLAVAGLCLVLTAATVVAAVDTQQDASRPIGEGEVFVSDAARASRIVTENDDPEVGVRLARNLLDVEAVSLVAPDGTIVASTSPDLDGRTLANPLLAYGLGESRFVALVAALETPLLIDGVEQWPAGSILYQVLSPLDDGTGAILTHYDVSELLARRARPSGLQTETLRILAVSAVFAILAVIVLMGHRRAVRRQRELAAESELLRAYSEELSVTNTRLTEARNEAERALALAEEKVRIRSEFVLMINHELRTPLTSVVTGAELIRDPAVTGRDREQVIDAIVSDGHRLQEIIDQILAVAQVENRGLTYVLTETPFEKVCAAVARSHAWDDLAGNHQHPGTMVRTDVRTLAHVISSLADNARTHGARQVRVGCWTEVHIDPAVTVGTRPESAVYFTVSDDGPGIDPSFLPRVFEKFEKSSFSSGTGLGLYMARMLVEALEGEIAVETSPGGTTFQIAVPCVRVAAMAVKR